MLCPLLPPYEFRFDEMDSYYTCMTDISYETNEDNEPEQIISAAALLNDMGGSRYELLHGIHVYDVTLDRGWMFYKRREAKEAYHLAVKPFVLENLHEGTLLLLDRYRPQTIVCRTEEQTPLDEFPPRFKATIDFLETQGYKAGFIHQGADRRWSWEHQRELNQS